MQSWPIKSESMKSEIRYQDYFLNKIYFKINLVLQKNCRDATEF